LKESTSRAKNQLTWVIIKLRAEPFGRCNSIELAKATGEGKYQDRGSKAHESCPVITLAVRIGSERGVRPSQNNYFWERRRKEWSNLKGNLLSRKEGDCRYHVLLGG